MRSFHRVQVAALLAAGLGMLAAAPERGDPVARISTAPGASEYWDFLATFDSGERLAARFMLTNELPGDTAGVAVGQFVSADGTTHAFRNGRLAGNWTLAADRRSMKIGSSRLALGPPEIALDVDNDKRGVQIHLRLQPGSRASAGPELPDTSVDVLALTAPISGTVWFTGMTAPLTLRGRAGITHTWMDPRESDRMLRRFDFFGRDGAVALYLGYAMAPDGSHAAQLTIERDGKPFINVTQITISLGDGQTLELGPGYPVPKQLNLSGVGISGVIHLNKTVAKHDPLQDLPLASRLLVSLFAHPQRVWMDSRFEVRIERSPSSSSLQAQGSGLTAVTFTNPLPSATSQRHPTD